MLPTFAELAGAAAPAGDGVSILPTLLEKPGQPPRQDALYWEAAPQQAVRLGDWKAYRAAPSKPIELYNLAQDIGESHNLAASHPDMAAKLEELLTASRTESPDFPLKKKAKK
jgi:arylsulfatase A-like enzyme